MQLHTLLPLIIYLGTATAVPLGGDESGAGAGSEGRTGLEALRDAKIFGAPEMFMKGPISKRGEGKSGEDDDCDDDDQAEDDKVRNMERALEERFDWAKVGAAGTALGGIAGIGGLIKSFFDKDKRDLNGADAFAEVEAQLKSLYGRDLDDATTYVEFTPEQENQLKTLYGRDLTLEERFNWGKIGSVLGPLGTAAGGLMGIGGLAHQIFGGGDKKEEQQQQQNGEQQNGKRDYQTTELSPEIQDQLQALYGRDLGLEERAIWGPLLKWGPLAAAGIGAIFGNRGGDKKEEEQQQQNGKRDYQVTELSPEIQDQLQTLYGRDLGLEERAIWGPLLKWGPLAAAGIGAIFGNRGGDKKEENGKRDYQVTELSPEIQDQLKALYGRDLTVEERGLGDLLGPILKIFGIGGKDKRDLQAEDLENELKTLLGRDLNFEERGILDFFPVIKGIVGMIGGGKGKRDLQTEDLENELKTLFGRDLTVEERGLSDLFSGILNIFGLGKNKRDLQAEDLENELKTLFGLDLAIDERGFGGLLGNLIPLITGVMGGIGGKDKRDFQGELSPEVENELKTLFGRDLTLEERFNWGTAANVIGGAGAVSSIIGSIIPLFKGGKDKRDFQGELSPEVENELKTLFGRDLTLEERFNWGTAANVVGATGAVSSIIGSIIPLFKGGKDKRDFQAEDLENELKTLFGRDLILEDRGLSRLGKLLNMPAASTPIINTGFHYFNQKDSEQQHAARSHDERAIDWSRITAASLGPLRGGGLYPWWRSPPAPQRQGKRGYEDWEKELSEQLRAGFARGLNALD